MEQDAAAMALTELMSHQFEAIPPEMPLRELFQRLIDIGCGDLVVLDSKGRFMGVISGIDLLGVVGTFIGVRSMKRGSCIDYLMKRGIGTAADLMKRGHIVISRDGTVREAMRLMEKNRYPELFVIDDDGRVMGRIDACSIIKHLQLAGQL